ncbi:GGDEF domain-containing protein [Mariprofundus sp. EBB-1]|uniref:GGDEF domain-containing protein n=1 Tax=Mariprofundus sp. EBB-1 TaxID=2650971 RepID=UPI000EF2418D|nr:GGDEF domain-containing protein [Mariprofundus sp. EBB-1]
MFRFSAWLQKKTDIIKRSLALRVALLLMLSYVAAMLVLVLLIPHWSQIAVVLLVLLLMILTQWMLLSHMVVTPIQHLQRLARKNAVPDALTDARLAARGDEIGSLRLTMLATDQEVQSQQQAMQTLTEKMDKDRRHDPLTKLHNRRHLYLEGPAQFEMAHRLNYPVSVMMIDLDLFKHINDTYGHSAGDKVLVDVALALGEHSRVYDILIRFGGEEFTLILLNCNQQQSMQIAERIREDIEMLNVSFDQMIIPVTCSIGVSSATQMDMEQMIPLADEAVYKAKSAGRNCVRHVDDR